MKNGKLPFSQSKRSFVYKKVRDLLKTQKIVIVLQTKMSEEFHLNSKKIGLEFFSAPNAIAKQALKDTLNQELSVSLDGPCYFIYLKDFSESDPLGIKMRFRLIQIFEEAKDCVLVSTILEKKLYHNSTLTTILNGFTFPMITYLKLKELSLILTQNEIR